MPRARFGLLALVTACGPGFAVRSDHGVDPHPPASSRVEAMPELIRLASLDLDCPEPSLSWNCPDGVCIEDQWPGNSTTIVSGCMREAIYKFQRGRWRATSLDGVER
jgi:hypothetical protein